MPENEAISGLEIGKHFFCAPMPKVGEVQGQASSLDGAVKWMVISDKIILGLHQNQLVEYDVETRSPIGLVCQDLGRREVSISLFPLPSDTFLVVEGFTFALLRAGEVSASSWERVGGHCD